MRIPTLLMSGCLVLLSTIACAQTAKYDHDRAANHSSDKTYASYKTYAWTGDPWLTGELDHARVVRAIEAALASKGLVRVEPGASPDVLVAYYVSLELDLQMSESSHGGPFGPSGHGWGAVRVPPVLVGTVVVDIADARTSAIVWRGLASSDIKLTDKPENRDKRLMKATEKMFKSYPPKP
jgi:hypothetical protein